MFVLRHAKHGKFSKYKIGEIMIVELEFKWCFKWES